MRKFTQKEYEELCAILSELYTHPGMNIYNDSVENEILVKLYNWFNNNTYGFIEFIVGKDSLIENIFYKIYLLVKKIKEGSFTHTEYISILERLKSYYNRIENTAKTSKLNEEDKVETIKETVNEFLDYIDFSKNNVEASINKFNEKIKQYNLQADKDSEDLTINKKGALADIELSRKDFYQSIDNYKKDIERTKEKLIKQYDDLNEYHDNFQNKIYKELDDIQNSVNREQLAAYFLNERKKLKGDIELPVLIYSFLFEIIYFLTIDCYITASWHQFIFLKFFVLAICIFILILPCVQFLYYKIIIKNEGAKVRPFDEMKALLTPYWCWLGLTFSGMACIAKIAYSLYYINSTKFDHLEPYLLFANLPVFMILVWFTWFCSKQFSYTKQICDEYEYKYALSKSYLSYSDEAKNVSDNDRGKYDAIMVSLLDSVIKNIATSPVKSVKPDCHTPFTEVFGSLKDIIKTTDKKD